MRRSPAPGNARPSAELQSRRVSLPPDELAATYARVRARTLQGVAGLSAEDLALQSMPDASPGKWHLAHTTWFFEAFVLERVVPGYAPFDRRFGYLFNSYYEALGARQPQSERGLLSRPALADVLDYRAHVDRHMQNVFGAACRPGLKALLQLGIAHEEQHQELLASDLLHLFAQSPLAPKLDPSWRPRGGGRAAAWRALAGGLLEIGHEGDGFAFDNEGPRHRVWLEPFRIADRLVTNGEWLAFMSAGGYRRADLWSSDGWARAQQEAWQAPLYWRRDGERWHEFTPAGWLPLAADAAVAHVSWYEADAYARWAGARLPSEAEWEVAAAAGELEQRDDTLWQWTRSAYAPYPGYRAVEGALGEYNGKFMVNQMVLRGGAAATPPGHARLSYRNFYAPDKRWLFGGVRLACDARTSARRAGPAAAADAAFAADVLGGLERAPRSIPPKYFYDADGTRLFDEICRTPEYYVARSECALLRRIAPVLAQHLPPHTVLVEFGSGASEKTRLLLDAAPQVDCYVPIDINAGLLRSVAARLARDYPGLRVLPLVADFSAELRLPQEAGQAPRVGFFPGSTLGNLLPEEARAFLHRSRRLLGVRGRLILGLDLVKERTLLEAAYDDAAGVTARFNANLLLRINRELQGDFDPAGFRHVALWNEAEQRVEMHLESRCDQRVRVAGRSFEFRTGERLHTENAYKWTLASARRLAEAGGWRVAQAWVSEAPEVALFLLEPAAAGVPTTD